MIWTNPAIYLKSDEAQYIDTNFIPTNNSEMEICAAIGNREIYFGSRAGAYTAAFAILMRRNEKDGYITLGDYNSALSIHLDNVNTKHIVKLSAPQTSC